MRVHRTFVPAVLAMSFLTSYAVGQTSTYARPSARVLNPIDSYTTITLHGNVHPLAAANRPIAVDLSIPMEHIVLLLKGDAQQETLLAQLVAAQNDPKSPQFHQFLTPQQFGSQFGVAASDLQKITAWLESHGFTIDEVPAGNRAIVFSGTAEQVAETFKTEIGRYNIGGTTHYANIDDPQIPAALAGVVGGIVKLHNFRYQPHISKIATLSEAQTANPKFTYGSSHYLAPADYATIYDINPLYSANINGSGQSIAVLARSNISLPDVQSFRSTFGLPANNPQIVITNTDPGILSGDSTETTLDTEWSGAVAPKAAIKVIVSSSTNTADGIDLSALYAVNKNVAPIVSLSYGSCEAAMGTAELAFYNSLWQQAAAQGMTVMVSAGDSGAAGCDYGGSTTGSVRGVNGLCSSPYSTCVGGTEFVEGSNPGQYWLPGNNSVYGSAISYIPEAVWNESASAGGSGLWAAGGGASNTYPKPSWQAGPGVPADGYRDVPDVSLTAASHDGYVIVQSGYLEAVGGTSASAPSFAGLMALVDQKMNAHQGLANAVFYPLAAKQATGGAKIFHDITSGNNSVPGVTGFSAATGYDQASGLGSVDAALLVNHWTDATQKSNPTFALTASVNVLTVNAGNSGKLTVSTTPQNAFNSSIALSMTGLPSGVTGSFAPATITGSVTGSSTLTVAVPASAKSGTYPLVITATGGGVTQNVTVTLTIAVPTFTISSATTALSVTAGNSAKLTVSATPQNGFNSSIALSVAGLPSGLTASFAPASVTGSTAGSSTLTLTVPTSTKAGTYNLIIVGNGGGVTQNVPVALSIAPVPNAFNLTLASNTATVKLGASTGIGITTAHQGVFNSAITLSASGMPTGIAASFSKNAIAAPGDGTATLTFAVSSNAKPGTYPITVSASGGGQTNTAQLSLTVSANADFALLVNTTNISIGQGGTASSVTVSTGQFTGGFNSTITITFSGLAPGMNWAVTGSSTGNNLVNTSVVFSAASSTPTGAYPITVNATGGGVTHTAIIQATVTKPSTNTKH